MRDRISAASDSTAGLKDKARENIATRVPSVDAEGNDNAERLIARFDTLPEDERFSLWAKLTNLFDDKYGQAYNKVVNEEVEKLKADRPKGETVPNDQLAQMRQDYNTKVKSWNALQEVAIAFGQPDALKKFGTFSSIRGALGGGTRGKRFALPYVWTVGDDEKEYTTLTEVAKAIGGGAKAGEIRKALMSEYNLGEEDVADETKLEDVMVIKYKDKQIKGVVKDEEEEDETEAVEEASV